MIEVLTNELVALVAIGTAGVCWCVARLLESRERLRRLELRRETLDELARELGIVEPSRGDPRPIQPRPVEASSSIDTRQDPASFGFGLNDLMATLLPTITAGAAVLGATALKNAVEKAKER